MELGLRYSCPWDTETRQIGGIILRVDGVNGWWTESWLLRRSFGLYGRIPRVGRGFKQKLRIRLSKISYLASWQKWVTNYKKTRCLQGRYWVSQLSFATFEVASLLAALGALGTLFFWPHHRCDYHQGANSRVLSSSILPHVPSKACPSVNPSKYASPTIS